MRFVVSGSAELSKAISAAKGGDTIMLKKGDYGDLVIYDKHFLDPITITSADPDDPTEFSGRVAVTSSSGITLSDLDFTLSDKTALSTFSQIQIGGSNNISVVRSRIEGVIPDDTQVVRPEDIDGDYWLGEPVAGYAAGLGIRLTSSTNITIDQVEAFNLTTAISIGASDRVSVTNSNIHDIRSDGIMLRDASWVKIQDNLFHSFKPLWITNDFHVASDHPDFIQYHGTGATRGIDRMTISGNAMLQGDGGWTQAIFGRMANAEADGDIRFTNFRIHDNLIVTSHPNALWLGDVEGAVINNNTVLPAVQDSSRIQSTTGVPTIGLSTDVEPDESGAWENKGGVMPSEVWIYNNVTTTNWRGDAVSFSRIPEDIIKAQKIGVYVNVGLSADETDPDWWGNVYPGAADGNIRDVAEMTGTGASGVRSLAPWLVEAVNTLVPDHLDDGSAHPGDDRITGGDDGERLVGGAGDDTITGGAGADTLWAGEGDDVLTGGGRGDHFSLRFPDSGRSETDIITDLDFSEGDVIAFTEGVPFRFFDNSKDPDNDLLIYASDALINSEADINEILMHDGVSSVKNRNGDLELRFDIDYDGTTDYRLILQGYDAPATPPAPVPGPRPVPAPVEPPVTEITPSDASYFLKGDGSMVDLARVSRISFSDGETIAVTTGASLRDHPGLDGIEIIGVSGNPAIMIDDMSDFITLEAAGYARIFDYQDRVTSVVFIFPNDGPSGNRSSMIFYGAARDELMAAWKPEAPIAPEIPAVPEVPPAPPAPVEPEPEVTLPDPVTFDAGALSDGGSLEISGFPAGYFSRLGLTTSRDGSAAVISSVDDLAKLASSSKVETVRESAGTVTFRLSVDGFREDAEVTVEHLSIAGARLLSSGSEAAPKGKGGRDVFEFGPTGETTGSDTFFDLEQNDILLFRGFEAGTFSDTSAGATWLNGSYLLLRGSGDIAALDQLPEFSVEGDASDGFSVIHHAAEGDRRFDFQFHEDEDSSAGWLFT